MRSLTDELHQLFCKSEPSEYVPTLARLRHLASVDELFGCFRLPVAGSFSPICIRKNTDPPAQDVKTIVVLGHDQRSSTAGPGGRVVRGIPVEQLTKHCFSSGMSGSGKTTANVNIMHQLQVRNIPFLVLEPVKTEYRTLKGLGNNADAKLRDLANTLEVYTPGNQDISPYRFNPLELLPGVSQDEHIDNVLNCFLAAMPVTGPLPALLSEALESVYADRSVSRSPPIMAELVSAVEQVLATKRYSSETASDVRAALDVRLSVLTHRTIGKVFQCRRSVPSIDHIVRTPTIIELKGLTSPTACLLSLFVLTALREHFAANPPSEQGSLRYVIFIEEAHNIVGRAADARASETIADPKAFAAEFVCCMLAELRALGVGVVIIDSLPSAVAPQVMKNTSSKLAFRQVDKDDRLDIGKAMLFGETEMADIARLEPGEAFFFIEGYHGPRRIETIDTYEQLSLPKLLTDRQLCSQIHEEEFFRHALSTRRGEELIQLKQCMDRFDEMRIELNQEMIRVIRKSTEALSSKASKARTSRLAVLVRVAHSLKLALASEYRRFVDGPHKSLLAESLGLDDTVSDINQMRAAIVQRFEDVIKPDTQSCLDRLDKQIRKLRELEGWLCAATNAVSVADR